MDPGGRVLLVQEGRFELLPGARAESRPLHFKGDPPRPPEPGRALPQQSAAIPDDEERSLVEKPPHAHGAGGATRRDGDPLRDLPTTGRSSARGWVGYATR